MSKLRICTYNIRTEANDGINAFPNRKELIAKEFPKYDCDVVGYQETMPGQRQWVIDTFTDYNVFGMGRNADLLGESNIVMAKKSRFDVVTLDTFWLSDTPRLAGTRFSTDQSSCPRICTTVTLRDRESGKCFRHYNTHLDHIGAFAQAQGISLILNRIAADYTTWQLPVILTGDFNVTPDSMVYSSVIGFGGCGTPLVDVTADVGGTYHGYHPAEKRIKIDFIFTNLPLADEKPFCAEDECDGVYLSDHFPVIADLLL